MLKYNNFLTTFSDDMLQIDRRMMNILEQHVSVAPLFGDMINHSFGWDVEEEKRKPIGKRIRPLITLLVGQALNNNREALIAIGATIELIHNFTLIHDDIMDQSVERRHRRTVWNVWGTAQSINAGDGLYALANLSVLDLRLYSVSHGQIFNIFRELTLACLSIVDGQILDVAFESRDDVTSEEYICMVSAKTAALIACSAKVGAMLGSDDPSLAHKYSVFGHNLGVAFQMLDDYLGIWGSEDLTGKSASNDIQRKKKTLPLLWAFENASPTQRQVLQDIYSKPIIGDAEILQVRDIFSETGADIHTRQLVEDYHHQALESLEATQIANEQQDRLVSLANFLLEREF